MTESGNLTPNDLLVYISIKSFMNKDTKKCFPSLKTIASKCGFSVPTVRKSIDLLTKEGWICIEKKNRKQIYWFPPHKNFEVFSPEFIDNNEVTPREKAYIMSSQQYMYKDASGFGKISYSTKELSDKINLSSHLINKHNKSLEEKGFLSIIGTDKRAESGIAINENFFHLTELGQAVIFALQKHEERLDDHDDRIEKLEEMLRKVLKENDKLKKERRDKDIEDTGIIEI